MTAPNTSPRATARVPTLLLEETTVIVQFIDHFVRKSDVFSALKRANVPRILIDITERSFLMLEAA